MIPPLTHDQIEAVRGVARAFDGVPIALVGAAALGCHLPLRDKTEDVDFLVATTVESLRVLAETPDWQRHATKEHQWTAPNGVEIDVVPASHDAMKEGVLRWPKSGHTMNLTGIRLVFETGQLLAVADNLKLRVPSVSVIALLKMIAYLDRYERTTKDLSHLALIFDQFPADDDDRMYTHEQAVAGLTPDEARAQVLARELAALVDGRERADCARFVGCLRDDPTHTARMLRVMLQPKEERDALLARRLEILTMELSLSSTGNEVGFSFRSTNRSVRDR